MLFAWRERASDVPTYCQREEVNEVTLEQLDAIDTNADAAEMAASLGSQTC
ncbi:microvionin family RiPP [Auritidibacter ignavus]|uniref:microvionin family RiPP n=1 Tax=Auritidibacter ignavus TaxID=678932 RepID=UPI00387ED05C